MPSEAKLERFRFNQSLGSRGKAHGAYTLVREYAASEG
jgi:hypothetical protein